MLGEGERMRGRGRGAVGFVGGKGCLCASVSAISLTFLSVPLFDSLDGSDKCQRCHWIGFNYT